MPSMKVSVSSCWRVRQVLGSLRLVRAWKARGAKLDALYRSTDIIGTLLLAEQIYTQQSRQERKILVIYSDMRNSTADLDLEFHATLPSFSRINKRHEIPIANLQGVEVSVLGVDSAGKPTDYWLSLRNFWTEYFKRAEAVLGMFSVLREPIQFVKALR
jgi:hypothetical protein